MATVRYKLNIQYSSGITDVLECKSRQEVEIWQSLFDATVKNWLLIDCISNKIIDRHTPPIRHFY